MDCLDRYTEEPAYDETFGAKVFKVSRDERGERLVFLRLTGGKLAVRTCCTAPMRTGSRGKRR